MEHATCGLRELKFAGDGDAMTFSGYGAVFNSEDRTGDVILPGAFKRSLREAKGQLPPMLLEHGGVLGLGSASDMVPIGLWTEMAENDVGLRVEGKLADTARGREVYTLLKMEPRPAISGLSIGYLAKEFTFGTKPGEARRTLKRVDLFEVSLVTRPAQPAAQVTDVKSRSGMTERDAERALRDAGFSRAEAKAIVAAGFKTLDQRDAGEADETATALKQLLSTITR